MADQTNTLAALERLHEAATPGPWCSYRQGNQYLGTAYMPTARGVAASVVRGVLRPWNPHAAIAFGLKAEQHEEVRFTDADADLVAVMRNVLPDLLKQARLAATLTSILCADEGQDVVERAKGLVETERGSERLAADRRANKRHVIEHEDLERLIADAKRSGYVSAIGALHNAMPPGFVEPDADKVIGRVVAALAEKDTIEASLRSRVELLTQKLTDCEGALDQYRALATTADNLEQENARLREHIRTARKS